MAPEEWEMVYNLREEMTEFAYVFRQNSLMFSVGAQKEKRRFKDYV